MKKMFFLFWIAPLAALVWMGCATTSTSQLYATVKNLDGDLVAEKPAWHRGESWTYKVTKNGKIHYYTITVVEENLILDGESCYKLEYVWYKKIPPGGEKGRHWEFYSKDLTYLGKQKPDGKMEKPAHSPIKICFPLRNNQKWSHTHYQPDLTIDVGVIYRSTLEEIEGPLGRFPAFKVRREFLMIDEDRLDPNYVEFWYAPDYKFIFAKMVFYNHVEGWTRITELINYQSKNKKD